MTAGEIMDFEREAAGWSRPRKLRAIRERFGVTSTRYHSDLARILDLPAVFADAPDVVGRLRRIRDVRRSARRFGAAPLPVPQRRQLPLRFPARPRAKEGSMDQLTFDPIARAEEHLAEASAAIGEAKKEAGMALADGAAAPEWKAAVDAAIAELAETRFDDTGEAVPFTAEDIRRIAGDPPGHPNALGARFSAAARRGHIRKVGYRKSKRASLHAHPIALWVGSNGSGAA